MFDKTRNILESTESGLLGFSTQKSYLKPVQRLFIYPLMFLKVGFGDFTRPVAIWSFISFGLMLLLALFAEKLNLPNQVNIIMLNVCIWGVLLLVSFSTPSTYAFYGANKKSIEMTVAILVENEITNIEEIEFLESNLEKVEERIEERIKFYKWLIGSVWGIYILMVNFQFRVVSFLDIKADENWLKEQIMEFGYVMFFTVIALLFMVCYKRASKMLIVNLQYACTQQKYGIKKLEYA